MSATSSPDVLVARAVRKKAYDRAYYQLRKTKSLLPKIHAVPSGKLCACGCGKSLTSMGTFNKGHWNRPKHRGPYKLWTPEQKAAYNLGYKKTVSGKERRRIAWKKYILRYPEKTLWRSARERAKKNGITFTITTKDIVIPTLCPILGIPLAPRGDGTGHRPESPSVDRIIPALGYVPGNIAVVSHRANQIKSNATLEELLLLAKWAEREIFRVRREFKL